jgi:hypothetical protein
VQGDEHMLAVMERLYHAMDNCYVMVYLRLLWSKTVNTCAHHVCLRTQQVDGPSTTPLKDRVVVWVARERDEGERELSDIETSCGKGEESPDIWVYCHMTCT